MFVIVHFNEILLKGKNKNFFIQKLRESIGSTLAFTRIRRVKSGFELEWGSEETFDSLTKSLKKIFGIANFSFVEKINADIENLKKKALDNVLEKQNALQSASPRKNITFGIRTHRIDKNYPLQSTEINYKVGGFVKKITNLEVNITQPDIRIFIDIFSKEQAYVYTEKIQGIGGLPMGSSAPLLSLVSAGFDSPVASWMMMKRGSHLTFLHFHSYPFSDSRSIENVKKNIKTLKTYQGETVLYLFPIGEIQKQILSSCPDKYLVIIYRRIMLKMAEKLADSLSIRGLVTGESLGQVASQTVENMDTIARAARLPIFRPLIGFDKEEIMNMARKIGTYDVSKLPYDDCCSRFVPKNPATKSFPNDLEKIEKNFPIDEYINEAFKKMEKFLQ